MDLIFRTVMETMTKRGTVKLLITAMLALSACIPDPLAVEGIPVVKPEIVVSTQIVPDESLVVLLTKTFGALEASEESEPEDLLEQIAVSDAEVVIMGPRGSYTLLALGSGVYGGVDIPFEAGQEYSLHVKSESLGEVTATTIVKPQVLFDAIEAELEYTEFGDTLAQITYRLNDPSERNWYMLNVLEIEQDELLESILNPRDFIRLLEDSEFNGLSYRETFRVFPRDFAPDDTIAVYLSNIDQTYYDFIQLRVDNRFSFIQFLSEPVNYPSNVKGGKGFFNLYIPDIRFFIFD